MAKAKDKEVDLGNPDEPATTAQPDGPAPPGVDTPKTDKK